MIIQFRFNPAYPATRDIRIPASLDPAINKWNRFPKKYAYKWLIKSHEQTGWELVEVPYNFLHPSR